MKAKALEVRDEGTFIPVLAVDMNPTTYINNADAHLSQRYLLRRCGYPCDGKPNIMITNMNGGDKANNDIYNWGGRTYPVAHNYIVHHWDELVDGDVIDVQFILGETKEPKLSEKYTAR